MALLTPRCRMAKNMMCPYSAFFPADPKTVSKVTNKMLQPQKLIYTTLVSKTTLPFWFQLFRSADKIHEDDALVHLVLVHLVKANESRSSSLV